LPVFIIWVLLLHGSVACLLSEVADDAKVHRNPTLTSMIDLDKYELFKSDGHFKVLSTRSYLWAGCGGSVSGCLHAVVGI
jgi:hypothetical protein